MTIAQQLATHITQAHKLSDDVISQVDSLVFDYIGVTVSGAERASARAVRNACSITDKQDELRPARIFGVCGWASREEAALVNGVTAHGLELDDTHEPGSLHPGVAVLPAVFAFADAHPVSATEFRRAIAIGYDVMTSVGVLLGASESYARGFHPTGVCGAVGAAAAISVLMGLTIEQATHALGLAANMASGSLEFLSDGSWTKRLNAGHAAATGLRAARLAQTGFTAPAQAFEGRDGFLRQYGNGLVAGRELDIEPGIGVRETSIKLYPCCRYMHGNIDLLRDIRAELPQLSLAEVERIECAVISAGAALVSQPRERKLTVTSSVDAQFNMLFGAAVALATGRADVGQFDNAVSVATELEPWMSKVTCYESARVEQAFPASWQAEVRVHLVGGRVIERYSEAYLGSPKKPPAPADIMAKLTGLVDAQWLLDMSDRVAEMGTMERVDSASLLNSC